MPASQSKELAPDDAQVRKERAMAQVFGRSIMIQLISNTATLNARPSMMLGFTNNDSGEAARLMGLMVSAGGVLEFLLNPLFGRLSDKYGRFIFILLGPIGQLLCDGAISLFPGSMTALVAGRVITGMTMTAFVTLFRASMADVLSGKALAAANSGSALYSGVGIVFGPWLGSRLGSDRNAFALSALFSAINAGYLISNYQETLPVEERKEIDWNSCNPLSFLSLFTKGNTLTLLCAAVFFQSLGELRFTFDVATLIWRTASTVGNFAAVVGVGYIVAGIMGKKTTKWYGLDGHTTMSNVVNAVANLIWAADTGLVGSTVGNLAMMAGHRKRDGVEAMLYKVGADKGWGKGSMSGMLANLKSVAFIFAPQIYSRVYAATTSGTSKFHGSPMVAAALTAVSAELCMRAISAAEKKSAMTEKKAK